MRENTLENELRFNQKDVNKMADLARNEDILGSTDEKTILDLVREPAILADNEVAPLMKKLDKITGLLKDEKIKESERNELEEEKKDVIAQIYEAKDRHMNAAMLKVEDAKKNGSPEEIEVAKRVTSALRERIYPESQ